MANAMLQNKHGLTEKQAAFVSALCTLGDKSRAVLEAGYDITSHDASALADSVLRSRAVQHALRHEINRRFLEGAAMAFNVLRDIARDATAPKGVRVDAAKAILDRAGFVAPRNGAEQGATLDLASMSPDQLRAFIAQGEQELAARAKTVSAPEALQSASQVTDLLD